MCLFHFSLTKMKIPREKRDKQQYSDCPRRFDAGGHHRLAPDARAKLVRNQQLHAGRSHAQPTHSAQPIFTRIAQKLVILTHAYQRKQRWATMGTGNAPGMATAHHTTNRPTVIG